MRRVLRGLGWLLLGIVIFVPGWVTWHSRDLTEIDRGGLDWQPRTIEPEDAAWPGLVAAAQQILEPDEHWERQRAARRGDPEARRTLAPVLARNREALAAFEAALARPTLAFPLREPGDVSMDGYMELNRVGAAARLLLQRSWDHEDPAEALEALLRVADLGVRIQAAEGATLSHGMQGLAIQGMALDAIASWASQRALPTEERRALIRRLDRYRHDPEVWLRISAYDLDWTERTMVAGMAEVDAQGWEPGEDDPFWVRFLPMDYFYHHNRTVTDLAREARAFATTCATLPDHPERAVEPELPSYPSALLLPNGVGRLLVSVAPSQFRFAMEICGQDARVAATQAIVALRGWRDDHGGLPDRLTELVPDYLDALPRDPFDGEPLRYDPENGWLYSVGADLVDAGGHPDAEAAHAFRAEPTFRFAFSPPSG